MACASIHSTSLRLSCASNCTSAPISTGATNVMSERLRNLGGTPVARQPHAKAVSNARRISQPPKILPCTLRSVSAAQNIGVGAETLVGPVTRGQGAVRTLRHCHIHAADPRVLRVEHVSGARRRCSPFSCFEKQVMHEG